MPDSDMLLSTMPDVARHCLSLTDYRKLRWRPPKPEIDIAIERIEPATRFQRLPPIATMPDMFVMLADVG